MPKYISGETRWNSMHNMIMTSWVGDLLEGLGMGSILLNYSLDAMLFEARSIDGGWTLSKTMVQHLQSHQQS